VLSGKRTPGIDRRRVFVGDQQDAVAGTRRAVARGDREAIAAGRDQRDAVGVGADHVGKQRAQPFDVVKPIRARDPPRAGVTRKRGLARRAHRP
jgi:hypothetical protein